MLLQKKYFTPETQFVCDVCSEAVTHPICPSCITEEIQAWLTLYPNLRNELIPRLKEYLNEIEEKEIDSPICIKCHDKRAAVCTYCFTEKVLDELKKMNSNNLILREFLEFFNFDFYHTGYSREAERLEVI